MYKKKLIEVALPLDVINREAAREKSIRYGHPSTLHLWWARRPLATARAVIWASLVDDPSSRPEEFPTEEEQNNERERLFKILEQLVTWENSNDEMILNQAKAEILKSTNANPPEFLDPFAGGGGLPLEASRLGLNVHAHDLNPVAVLINKAMVEIPPLFQNLPPITPNEGTIDLKLNYSGLKGLAKDVEYFGKEVRKISEKKVQHLFPEVRLSDGSFVKPISWIWTRAIKCPNPACGCTMPLASTFELSKKKNNKTWISPIIDKDNNISYAVKDNGIVPEAPKLGRGKFKCICCGEVATTEYISKQFQEKSAENVLMAVVVEKNNKRIFLSPNETQIAATKCDLPNIYPDAEMNDKCSDLISGRGYGVKKWHELFTNRQLITLTTIADEIKKVTSRAEELAINKGLKNDHIPLQNGGSGALAYAQAITLYLSFGLSRMTNIFNQFCRWESSRQQALTLFNRQAIPMVWDFAENHPFGNAAGDFNVSLGSIIRVLENFKISEKGEASQHNAQEPYALNDLIISTDPPYYDNISYADLSDFFYIWLRFCLKDIYPELLSTLLVPKQDELIAAKHRHHSKQEAKEFFEKGMLEACKQIYLSSSDNFPVTIYYAYKQTDQDSEGKDVSSGWETMLNSIIQSGFAITGTWPMRTEMATRQIASGTNALASSIVLVCRKRDLNSRSISRRKFISELKKELKDSLVKLQQSNIAPVDMAQSAIGPGMGVYSKYKAVLESNGKPMSIRSALEIINQEVDIFFNEQDSDLHAEDRFCVDLYTQCGFDSIKYGEADTLARAKNTSVEKLAHSGTVFAEKGVVHLIDRDELKEVVDSNDPLWTLTQQLVRAMDKDGVDGAAKSLKEIHGRHESMKSLAYRLFTIAEKKNWAQEAYVYNNLVVAWPEIQDRLTELNSDNYETQTLF